MQKRFFFGLAMILLMASESHAALVKAKENPKPIPVSPFQTTGNALYDHFLQFAAGRQDSTMDSFLFALTEDPVFIGSTKTKALLYKSQSRHGSSFQNPRGLIVYGLADLILTFNGSSQQNNYQALEIMGYNKIKGEFEYRDIVFKKEQSVNSNDPNANPPTEVAFENPFIRIRNPNSSLCVQCHGKDKTYPEWGTYLGWIGAYGSYEEAFALLKSRYAKDSTNLEYTNLVQFQKNSANMARYQYFDWGDEAIEQHLSISNTLVGVLFNYKMANSAIQHSLAALSQPQNDKFKYAFAGYLLGCSDSFIPSQNPLSVSGDSEDNLRSMMAANLNERFAYEYKERTRITQDIDDLGGNLIWSGSASGQAFGMPQIPFYLANQMTTDNWHQPQSPFSMAAALTVRPLDLLKFARIDNLYNAMGLSLSMLYLRDDTNGDNSKTSWDGYNMIQDFMSDYILKYYNLPPITAANQIQSEMVDNIPHRFDLDMPLSPDDYQKQQPGIAALNLPPMSADKTQLCKTLSAASLAKLSK